VGGIEIRPMTAGDLEALEAGRCTCGCQDDPQGLAPVLREYPLGSPPDVAELEWDYAANMDGRWAPTWDAFEEQIGRLLKADLELMAAGERPPEQLSARELFAIGAWQAMEWTLGQRPKPPMWQGPPMPVCYDIIGLVAEGAERAAQGSVLPAYAAGVLAWLRWITGQAPEIVYPPA
jgi:hypothetical protein